MTSFQSVLRAWRSFRKVLQPRQRIRTWIIYLWSVCIAMADIAGLSAMVPVLMLAIDHSFLEKSRKLRWIFTHFGFETEAGFLIALIIFILAFFLLKSFFALLLNRYIRNTAMVISTGLSGRSYNYAFRHNDYEKAAASGLGFTDHVMYTPYYYVSGIYLPFINLLSESAVVFMLITVFTIYKPVLFLFTAGLLGITFYLVNRYTRNRIAKLGVARNKSRDEALNDLNLGISGFTDIKAHGVTSFFRERFLKRYSGFVNAGIRAVNYQLVPARINELAALSGIVILVIYGYFFSGDNLGEVRVLAALYAISVFRLIPAANRLMQSLMHLKMNSYTIDRLMLVADGENAENMVPSPKDFNQSIALKAIDFKYSESSELLFNNLNLDIHKGSIIGFSGPSGSGKTTLAKLLLGFHQPVSGHISIDGKSVPVNSDLLNLFSYMGQEPFVFSGTVSQNVALGIDEGKADKEKIKSALHLASFYLSGVGDLLTYHVGENGGRLSEGQKQRLVLAREIYRDAPVIILDEPTSSLDLETEKEVIDSLKKLNQSGKTILIVAHRSELLSICSEVYALKEGKLERVTNE